MAQQENKLIEAARQGRDQAVTPYSGFAVGAALEARNGGIFTGCNVESASYGLTMCAERVAVFKALSEGVREFVRAAVVTKGEALTTPCGTCRQVLWEHCGDIEIVLSNLSGREEIVRLSELLPRAFDDSSLDS